MVYNISLGWIETVKIHHNNYGGYKYNRQDLALKSTKHSSKPISSNQVWIGEEQNLLW